MHSRLSDATCIGGYGSSSLCEDSTLPGTSLPCRWKVPKSRKESNLKMSDAKFEKHVYGKPSSKVTYARQEDFDPRPAKYHGNVPGLLKELLEKVRGNGLGASLLFDESTRYWSDSAEVENVSGPHIPKIEELEKSI